MGGSSSKEEEVIKPNVPTPTTTISSGHTGAGISMPIEKKKPVSKPTLASPSPMAQKTNKLPSRPESGAGMQD